MSLQQFAHFSTGITGKSNDSQATLMCDFYSLEHIGRIATGRNGKKNISFATQCANLLGENFCIAVVIGNGG
jgi:hypothetical protein